MRPMRPAGRRRVQETAVAPVVDLVGGPSRGRDGGTGRPAVRLWGESRRRIASDARRSPPGALTTRSATGAAAGFIGPHPNLDGAEPFAGAKPAADRRLDLRELQGRDHARVDRPPDDE